MKKLTTLVLALVMVFSLAACGNKNSGTTSKEDTNKTEKPKTVTIKSFNANNEETDLEVPYDAQRIAVMDMAALDILDSLGLGDRVVGSSSTSLDYLQEYVTNDEIVDLGTIKEADMEAVMSCEPDVIFIGGRLAQSYDALSEIAPVVYLSTDTEIGLVKSVEKNAKTIASMFGVEDDVKDLMDGYDARIEKLKAFAEGKSAIIGMCTSGGFNVLGNDGRCALIGNEVGFENIGVDANVDAMKAKDKDTKDALSLLLAALKNKAIDKRADLTEEEEVQVILKEIKQTKESLEMTPSDRTDMIEECKRRLAVLETFAPKMMDADEIKAVVESVLSELGITAPTAKDKGRIMKELMPKVKGKADGKLVNEIVGSYMTE